MGFQSVCLFLFNDGVLVFRGMLPVDAGLGLLGETTSYSGIVKWWGLRILAPLLERAVSFSVDCGLNHWNTLLGVLCADMTLLV